MGDIENSNEPIAHTAIFQEKTIRRAWHSEEWWFSVVDVVAVLTDSADAKQYIKKMRSRDPVLNANWGTTYTPFLWSHPTASGVQPIVPTPRACSASSMHGIRQYHGGKHYE